MLLSILVSALDTSSAVNATITNANNPFITAFTFGEYGYTDDDQTNTTGGLMLSFTAFEK